MTLGEEVQESSVHSVPFDFEAYLSAPESPEKETIIFSMTNGLRELVAGFFKMPHSTSGYGTLAAIPEFYG